MKKFIAFFLAAGFLGLTGCAENLETLLRDPAFQEYEQKMDAVEKAYLDKEITYAEYLEYRREIEDEYARDVRPEREAVSDVEVMKDNERQPDEK